MAESKYLKWQDRNNDKIHDDCPVLDITPEPVVCLDCSPNPIAIVPDWKSRTIDDPFLNEKVCKFQVTVATKYTTTIDPSLLELAEDLDEEAAAAALEGRYREFELEAIRSLINTYNKAPSTANVEKLQAAIEHTDFSLNPRPKSRLKLLYSVPFTELNALDDVEEVEDEPVEESDVTVEYEAADLVTKMVMIRKGLNLYSRYLVVYRAVEGGNLLFEDGDGIFNLENYGDFGLIPESTTAELIQQLDAFLNQRNFNLPGTGPWTWGLSKVIRVEFTFNPEFKIKKLRVWQEGCPNTPIAFAGGRLEALQSKPAWRDPTACAYLARMDAMERDLTARAPKPWIDFIIEHTYPTVFATQLAGDRRDDTNPLSCIADALAEEGKQLGQEVLNEVFSIGDAIEYLFHNTMCRNDREKSWEDLGKMGIGPYGNSTGASAGTIGGMAKEQAFKRLSSSPNVFTRMCAGWLNLGKDAGIDELWYGSLDELKICGLMDMMMDVLKCLMGGLTLEETLASVAKAALQAMNFENFGILFVGLPPEKQIILEQKVKEKLESGEFFKAGSSGCPTQLMKARSLWMSSSQYRAK